jgi:hypothetical protein
MQLSNGVSGLRATGAGRAARPRGVVSGPTMRVRHLPPAFAEALQPWEPVDWPAWIWGPAGLSGSRADASALQVSVPPGTTSIQCAGRGPRRPDTGSGTTCRFSR